MNWTNETEAGLYYMAISITTQLDLSTLDNIESFIYLKEGNQHDDVI